MGNEATNQQSKPKGTGRFIHKLQQEDVLTEDFLIPDKGLLTVELWLRSAALYIKRRIMLKTTEELVQLSERIKADLPLAHALIRDIEDRAKLGTEKYGEALRAFNGRDPLIDSYQEVLDGWVYLRQNREEKEVQK